MSDLDDPLLARAKLLLEAARQTSEILKPSINIEIPDKSAKVSTKSGKSAKAAARLNNVFGATVFKGSTLINTHEDVRQHVGRGDQIVVDGYCCTISQTGEWTPTCIEITCDFLGENNFNATLAIATANNILNSPKRKKPMIPVASESIQQAVQQLNGFKEFCSSKLESLDSTSEKTSSGKLAKAPKKNKPRTTDKDLPYQSSFLSSNGGSGSLGSGYADTYNFQPPAVSLASSSAFPSSSLYNDYTSNSGQNQNYHTTSRPNDPIEYPMSEVEQNNLLNRKILEFNEQRRQESQLDPVKLAHNRVRQKALEEAKLKELQELEKEKKRQAELEASELKVNELKAKTQERVAKYKESLLKKAEEERLRAESELLAKKEREQALASENYKKKLIEHRKQSQKRLRQIELENERREQEKHIQMQQKLDAISKKFDVLSTYAPPSVMARRIQQSQKEEEGGGSSGDEDATTGRRKKSTSNAGNNSSRPSSRPGSAVKPGRVLSAKKNAKQASQQPMQSASAAAPWNPYAEIDPDFAGLYGGNGVATVPASKPNPTSKFQPIPRGEDEWSEDGDLGDLEEDSIELSKHSSSMYGNVKNNKQSSSYTTPSKSAYDAKNQLQRKYPSRDDSDNVSDVSGDGNNTQLRGADLMAYTQKSSSAKGSSKPGAGTSSSLHGRPSSQPITPVHQSSSKVGIAQSSQPKLPVIKKQIVSNTNSASSLLANQQYQQQVHQQSVNAMRNPYPAVAAGPPLLPVEAQRQMQQQQSSRSKQHSSPKKPAAGVWRKLQPIPVAPYKPVPTASER